MTRQKVHYSFKPGFDFLRSSQTLAVKTEIMQVLGIRYDSEFYKKRSDYPNIPAFIKEKIEEIFSRYGVDKRDIWDIRY